MQDCLSGSGGQAIKKARIIETPGCSLAFFLAELEHIVDHVRPGVPSLVLSEDRTRYYLDTSEFGF